MKKIVQRAAKSPYIPYLVLLAVMLVCHLALDVYAGGRDDTYYRNMMREGLVKKLTEHYQTWSARSLLEVFEALMSWLPPIVWRLVNPVVITFCAWGITALCGPASAAKQHDTRLSWAICGMMLLYPWATLSSAGWRVTTVVYVWTAAALLGALWPMAALMKGEKPGRLACILCVPCTLFAVNMEQLLVFFSVALALYAVWRLVNRQGLPAVLLVQAGLCVAMGLYTMTAPGVQNRFESEITSAYIDFSMLHFFDKAQIGISAALVPVVFERDYLFDGLCLLLAVVVWQNNRGWFARVLGVLPAAVSLGFSYGLSFLPGDTFRLVSNKGFITLANHDSLAAYLPLVLLYGVFVLVLVDMYLALGHRPLALVGAGILLCGLLSRAALGFSPTVFSSGARTGFFFAMAMVAAACLLLRELRRDSRFLWAGTYGYIGLFAVWRTAQFLQV